MSELPEIDIPEYPRKRDTLVGEEMEGMDEVIFVDAESGINISLNTVGASVLELCDGAHTPEDIVRIILDTVGGDETQVQRDVHDILQEFVAYDLFEA